MSPHTQRIEIKPMPKHGRAGSLASENSSNERLEPKLLKAIEAGDLGRVKDVLEEAQLAPKPRQNLLEIGLTRACDKDNVKIARFLLSWGANPDYIPQSKQPILLRAAEFGFVGIVHLLIDHNVNLEAKDKKGRTALMTAAWKDQFDIVVLLVQNDANVHAIDDRGRTVLHNIAADRGDEKKTLKNSDKIRQRCSMKIVNYLFQTGIDVDMRDHLGRTPLHWSSVTDNEALMYNLLETRLHGGSPMAEVNATDSREKTPLHLAVSHDRLNLARILLRHEADVNARSDGGWTPLHNACDEGSPELIQILVKSGANINSELLNGRTPLHVAAERGNITAVNYLLEQPGIKRTTRDRFGNTPLLMAALRKRKEIVEMLAPWNHVGALSHDEVEAAKQFEATIVDFGNFSNENRVTKRSVFELLYGRDRRNPKKHAVSTLPKIIKSTNFRWIHLPVNNVAWCDALLTKRFIEEGAGDVEGYKALETSFNHQHRGQQHHSRFMRPMCQVVQRAPPESEEPIMTFNEKDESKETPVVIVSEPVALPTIPGSPSPTPASLAKAAEPPTSPRPKPQSHSSESTVAGASSTRSPNSRQRSRQIGAGNNEQVKAPKKTTGRQQSRSSTDSMPVSGTKKSAGSLCNIYMFMPYLHFETDRRRKAMQTAMENATDLHLRPHLTKDEMLIRAHLSASSSFLHLRRTLDQFFYHNIDTRLRDCDQVVYRFQLKNHPNVDVDPKIFMVDQLWMWMLGKDLIVTSFPQRWDQPRNDPLNVLEGIIEEINSKTQEHVQSIHELAMLITGRCYGTFDRHRKADEEFQFLDMFAASIGSAMDGEASLFQDFSKASRQASAWLHRHERYTHSMRSAKTESGLRSAETDGGDAPHVHGREPIFVDELLDVGAETDLLAEIKDIRDELDIIRMVLDHQQHMMPELREAIKNIHKEDRSFAQLRKVEKIYDEQEKTIVNPLKDITRMDKQAERIYTSIRDLLDLKQKHANAFEARFARDQAAGTVRQGRTIMVFTIVTVVFLPLSFIAAVFAINISNFPKGPGGTQEMSLSFVSEYIFGIGLAISIPCIVIALTVDEVSYLAAELRRRVRKSWLRWRSRKQAPDGLVELQAFEIEQRLSLEKSLRRSVEVSWRDGPADAPRKSRVSGWDGTNGRRKLARRNSDIELGS